MYIEVAIFLILMLEILLLFFIHSNKKNITGINIIYILSCLIKFKLLSEKPSITISKSEIKKKYILFFEKGVFLIFDI